MKVKALLVLALVLAACGDSGDVDPAEAGSCRELVEVGMGFVQDMLDAVSDLSLDDIAAFGEDEQPAAFD